MHNYAGLIYAKLTQHINWCQLPGS